jgi:hypothetical protein
MGLLSRTKGKVFERKVCNILRERWPDIVVHRSSQADRAYQADIVVESGGPEALRRLWIECHDSRAPNVRAKLEQAEGDLLSAIDHTRGQIWSDVPAVVWHRLGERAYRVTLTLGGLLALETGGEDIGRSQLVTLELGEFLDMLEGR